MRAERYMPANAAWQQKCAASKLNNKKNDRTFQMTL